jgi:CDP-6-deoxy-D-xylo-4-hexulose-3-dehydrase
MGETITFGDRLKMAYFVMTTEKFTNGERVKRFEQEWNEWLGSRHSLYVSSGSTANLLLVDSVKELYGLKNGDKVLVPACTWVTNIAPIIQCGLQPIFCDINLRNFSFDLLQAREISKHHDIKLIFVTHLLGFSGANEELSKLFPNALIIDDICESHGCLSPYGARRGNTSLGATFSFYFGHHMSTIEGGMISTHNEDLYDLMKMKRSHGFARESIRFDKHAADYPDIDKQFLFMTNGYNLRNHEICAVLGSSQLKRLDNMIGIRRRNYIDFLRMLNSYPDLFHSIPHDPFNSSFCFPFICKSPKIMRYMKESFATYGIEYRPVVSGNLLRQPFLKGYSIEGKGPFNVDIVHDQGVYIGNSHFVTEDDMKFLGKVVNDIHDKFRRNN